LLVGWLLFPGRPGRPFRSRAESGCSDSTIFIHVGRRASDTFTRWRASAILFGAEDPISKKDKILVFEAVDSWAHPHTGTCTRPCWDGVVHRGGYITFHRYPIGPNEVASTMSIKLRITISGVEPRHTLPPDHPADNSKQSCTHVTRGTKEQYVLQHSLARLRYILPVSSSLT
jgi:hypothetical protein